MSRKMVGEEEKRREEWKIGRCKERRLKEQKKEKGIHLAAAAVRCVVAYVRPCLHDPNSAQAVFAAGSCHIGWLMERASESCAMQPTTAGSRAAPAGETPMSTSVTNRLFRMQTAWFFLM